MRLLIAVDGSDGARRAVDLVATFPFPAESEVTLLTVLAQPVTDRELEEASSKYQVAYATTRDRARDSAHNLLTEEADRLGRWQTDLRIEHGHPAEKIIQVSEEINADLIVVGSHGLTGFKRILLGSVSSQVLQSSRCSVLVVKTDKDSREHLPHRPRILLAFDGSPSASGAVDWCSSLDLEPGDEVDILTALPMVTMFRQDVRQELNWVWQQKRDSAADLLAAAATQIRTSGANVKTELVESEDEAHAILDYSEERRIDLIVLGHKGRGAIKRFLMGSVTPRIANHATCSVLAVRSG